MVPFCDGSDEDERGLSELLPGKQVEDYVCTIIGLLLVSRAAFLLWLLLVRGRSNIQ